MNDRIPLGIVTGCARRPAWLDPTNRQWYLLAQCVASKPVEHMLGAGIRAEMLSDDGVGRTLDWLYSRDPMKPFAGIAMQVR
jgi:hypothetical protein